MVLFHFKNPRISVSSHGIHPYVFKSFIIMQVWSTLTNFSDFLIVRIPNTTIFTATCVALKPDNFFVFVYFGGFFTFYCAQLFTLLFCLTRTLILYTSFNQEELCKKLFIVWSLFTYFLSFGGAAPNLFSYIVCMQLDTPYQNGALALSSSFLYGNNTMNIVHFVLSTVIIIVIVVITVLVVLRLRTEATRKTSNRSVRKTKAETTLTVTTLLIIIPLVLSQGLTITNFMNSPYFSYILVVRPFLLDLRVNVVSIYFYMTHPVFKKRKLNSGPATMFGSSTVQ